MFFPCHTEDPLIPKTVPLPLRAEILQRLRWEGRRDVPLWVSAGNLCWIPFAFFNKIQNHKLCKARKLKGQTLSGVHFKSEVQNAFNDIIAKGKNLFECKLLFEQGMNSQTLVQCSLGLLGLGTWGEEGRRNHCRESEGLFHYPRNQFDFSFGSGANRSWREEMQY